ncbi:P-loop containing nucleoside triphosphate hydrolase protein [Neohortaea acidophila]|uniref:ATP-dependent RNA helicase n=1 Tax=Neohortaea acidophila TaxID=245834 RepID=A0A6A6PST2_9PEZI|nr:P-loop containing nucleoside triphosphate hydrolase protein [Neohortaea acidophila]KAF2483158.1 P-loop containing nucleoside triphosphate hydrolase protein [Neohortaea acidophila]
MADDGMLLNFELPSGAFTPKETFRGGKWTDRLKAKKSADVRQKRTAGHFSRSIPKFGEVRSEDEELIVPGGPPSKRARTGDVEHSRPRDPTYGHQTSGKPSQSAAKGMTGEVISSLFTYNPKSVVPSTKTVQDESTEPSNAPLNNELDTFTSLGLSSTLANHLLKKLEIKAPTAIQRKAIEQLCRSDTDAFVQAETGSGKTLAYLLPIVQRINAISQGMKDAGQTFNRESGLFALVLAPTRELAKQINTVLESLLICCHWIVGGIVIGGEKKKSEKARLRKGMNVLVATPGRLADHLEHTEVLDVSRVRWLVLDEGDRLMELGFEDDIQRIVSVMNLRSKKTLLQPIPGLPERRTTVMCSATLKADVDHLKTITLKDPISISVDPAEARFDQDGAVMEQAFSAPAQLKQGYAVVPPKQRLVALVAMLKQTFKRKGSVMKCITFISCADSVDFHFDIFTRADPDATTEGKEDPTTTAESDPPSKSSKAKPGHIAQGNTISETRTQGPGLSFSTKENGVQVFRLHGSLQQATRTSTLKAFTKCAEPSLLVCTDVASRGLDLPNVDLVIEYDPPFSKEDHLHRIGRTARAGKDGRAVIFLMPGCEEGYVEVLKEGRPRNLTRHDAEDILKKGFAATSGVVSNNRDWEDRATEWQLELERWVLDNPQRLEQARRAFQSHVRAYTTHVAAERGYFDFQQMHLGHLAKAFALRDKPGSLRVPGMRPRSDGTASKGKEARRSKAANGAAAGRSARTDGVEVESNRNTDEAEGRRKMHAKMRNLGGASEFNLG